MNIDRLNLSCILEESVRHVFSIGCSMPTFCTFPCFVMIGIGLCGGAASSLCFCLCRGLLDFS